MTPNWKVIVQITFRRGVFASPSVDRMISVQCTPVRISVTKVLGRFQFPQHTLKSGRIKKHTYIDTVRPLWTKFSFLVSDIWHALIRDLSWTELWACDVGSSVKRRCADLIVSWEWLPENKVDSARGQSIGRTRWEVRKTTKSMVSWRE